MKTIKTLLLVLFTCLMSVSVARGGHIEDRDGKTIIHVTVTLMPNPTMTDTFNRAELAGIKEFKKRFSKIFAERYRDKYKAHPEIYGKHNWDNVEIELHQFSGIRVEGLEVDMLAIAGGVAPDILYVNFRKSGNYVKGGFLYPLDKPEDGYLSSMTKEEIDFRIHPKIWPAIRRKGPKGNKRVWAVPYGGALGKVLLYRKDLFDGNGLSYPTVQWTWEDMFKACKKISNPGKGIYGILLGQGKHESWHWVTFLWSAGGEVMTYNEEKDRWKCEFDSTYAAKALDYYVRLCTEKWTDKEGKIRRGYAYQESAEKAAKWERGEIGMKLEYIDEKVFAKINPEVTGMMPVPLGPPLKKGDDSTRMRGGELNSRMMGLFSQIKSRAVRDAAWEYIRFYECKDAQKIKTRIMVEGGLGRFVNPKYLKMFGYPEVERLAPKGWAEIFEIAIDTGKLEPYGKNSNTAYNMMTFPIQEAQQLALKGKLPTDEQERLDFLHKLLKKANARANEEMIGLITPADRKKRDITAMIVLAGIVIAFFMVFRKIFKLFTPPKAEGLEHVKQVKWGFRKYAWAYVLMIPAILTILIWKYVPLGSGSMMAFQDYKIIGDSKWVWVQNFGDLLYDPNWWQAIWNAVRYSFLVMILTFIPPIILAILLQEVPKGKITFRLIFYLPAMIAGLVMIILWKQFYDPSEHGVLNAIILNVPAIGFLAIGVVLLVLALVFTRRLIYHEMPLAAILFAVAGLILFFTGGSLAWPILFRDTDPSIWFGMKHFFARLFDYTAEAYRWRSNPNTAMISCVIPMVWAGMGPGCLIYLAALKGIAEDYYEAGDIDGATFVDKILFIVFPILKPLILINFIGVFIASWYGATANILVMTGGGANTETAGLYIFFKAFMYLKFGPATAAAWILAFMLIGFTVHQLRILSRLEFKTTGGKK